MNVSYDTLLVNEIVCRPGMIMIISPRTIIIIECNGVGNLKAFERVDYVCFAFFKFKFGSMNADEHKAFIFVCIVPFFYVGQRSHAIDAAIGPEIDEYYFTR